MSTLNRRKIMDDKKTIEALLNMLQKRNNDILNLEVQIAQLTGKLNDTKKEEEPKKAEEKSEKNK